ncbi:unnamed protein product [Clavelina lepadiformis]|uniref:Uncharacterized protein n=1 Tax=Clavelina lepadiformis TaxID=159417 RepID=A0ABP0FVJ3_CLALP
MSKNLKDFLFLDENFKDIHRGAEGSTKASTFEVVTEMPLVLRRQFRAISALVMTLLTAACDGILTSVFCMSSFQTSSQQEQIHQL